MKRPPGLAGPAPAARRLSLAASRFSLARRRLPLLLALVATLATSLAARAQVRVRNGVAEATIQPFLLPQGIVAFYAYGTVHQSSATTGLETPDTSLLFFYQQAAGPLSLVVIHDRFDNPDMPNQSALFTLRNLPAGTVYAVRDDPGGDLYTPIVGGQTTADWTWQECCTDGLALSDLGPDPFCIAVDPTFGPGIDAWQAASGPALPGSRFALNDLTATTWLCRDCQGLSCPATLTAECTGSGSAFVDVLAQGSSLCGGASISNDRTGGGASASDSYPVGTTTVLFTLTDDAGFVTTCATSVTVADDTPPVVTSCPPPLDLPCTGAPIPLDDPTVQQWLDGFQASDACDDVTLANDAPASFALQCPPVPVLVTFTATDLAGNSVSTCQSTVTVTDIVPPVVQGVPPDASVECDAVPEAPVLVASDNCDPAPVVTFQEVPTSGSCPQAYLLVRTWTATDACGNSSASSQTLTVVDTVPPMVQGVPPDATVECDAIPTAPTLVAVDSCDPAPVVTFQEVPTGGSCPQAYVLVRTWTATDACGNASASSQTLTVVDTVPPVVQGVPPDATVECDAVPTAPTLVAVDSCDPSPLVTFAEERTDGSCPDSYVLLRTWTASDACGNESAASQTLTVVDTTPPVLSQEPGDVTVACDAVPEVPAVTASDNCAPPPAVAFDEDRTDGPCTGSYSLLRSWTAEDRCANVTTHLQTITVVDSEPPVVTAGEGTLACLWPPNHKYVCFTQDDLLPVIAEGCSAPVSWRFTGCASDQCDEAPCDDHPGENGDGDTTRDCIVAPGGASFCVRSERAGSGPDAQAGRRYAVSVSASDGCGNTSPATVIGTIHVPHDQSPAVRHCRKP